MFYENLAWFTVLWICVLVARRLWRAAHQPVPASVSSPKRKTPRPKPRTPNDCPVCGRPHPAPIAGNVLKPGVLAWSKRKSPRNKRKMICPRPNCDYFGNINSTFHALVGDGKRGADGIQWQVPSLRPTLFQSAWHCPVSSPHSRRSGRASPLGRQLGSDCRRYCPALPAFRGDYSLVAHPCWAARRKGSRPFLLLPVPRPSPIG